MNYNHWKPTKKDIEHMKKLHALIPVGHENAISLDELSRIMSTCKRNAREIATQKMSVCNPTVCNMGDGNGYYVAKTQREIDDYAIYYASYLKTIARRVYRIKLAKANFNNYAMSFTDNA